MAPHTALLLINTEIHEKLPTGELEGIPKHTGKRVVAIDGVDKNDCQRKMNEALQELMKWSRE